MNLPVRSGEGALSHIEGGGVEAERAARVEAEHQPDAVCGASVDGRGGAGGGLGDSACYGGGRGLEGATGGESACGASSTEYPGEPSCWVGLGGGGLEVGGGGGWTAVMA